MRKFSTAIFILCILMGPSLVMAKAKDPKFFDAIKIYTDRDYVLNDTIEFAVFDMSEVKIINDSKEIKQKASVAGDEGAVQSGLDETQAELENISKYFYRELSAQVIAEKVPVSVYPASSPSYAKPLLLYIKIKRIHLKPNYIGKDGVSYVQPISIRIYGQINDKKSDETLIKFYDSSQAEFVLGQNLVKTAFKAIASDLMRDLSIYLRTKY